MFNRRSQRCTVDPTAASFHLVTPDTTVAEDRRSEAIYTHARTQTANERDRQTCERREEGADRKANADEMKSVSLAPTLLLASLVCSLFAIRAVSACENGVVELTSETFNSLGTFSSLPSSSGHWSLALGVQPKWAHGLRLLTSVISHVPLRTFGSEPKPVRHALASRRRKARDGYVLRTVVRPL